MQQLQEDMCHENEPNDALQQEVAILWGMQAPLPPSAGLPGLDADQGLLGHFGAHGDIKIIPRLKLS